MGTDITLVVEARTSGVWREVDPPLVVIGTGPNEGMNRCARCEGAGLAEGDRFVHLGNEAPTCPGSTRLGVAKRRDWYRRRDSTLFALLGVGLPRLDYLDEERAGLAIAPIAPARGLPPDASPTLRQRLEPTEWGLSWLLLSELLEFDWSRPVFHAAWAPVAGLSELQAWLDRVGDLPPSDPSPLLSTDLLCPPTHARLTWTQPLWQHVNPMFFGLLLQLTRLAKGRPDDVRCVFCFC